MDSKEQAIKQFLNTVQRFNYSISVLELALNNLNIAKIKKAVENTKIQLQEIQDARFNVLRAYDYV